MFRDVSYIGLAKKQTLKSSFIHLFVFKESIVIKYLLNTYICTHTHIQSTYKSTEIKQPLSLWNKEFIVSKEGNYPIEKLHCGAGIIISSR